ncbi:Zinc carboxypeptidase [Streptoalloteichus tenebrarius]|uniref:Zinc carboxypeptidase n=1 Tax=Streptoalloteichus tenebrarius (strain ATCC 17920 / DSM 40477 / JCM 4838 / CBS 697.72 / NBRC 16177 / NCIMB 11028 / NRRL B-12390 / A12253. 1 / ISP 5477) TaxID=1933 RepID=A0ABT1I2W2_STRSD|nr:M14 family zinc carboxypeptidase [Streptoalloteichus tenebrarius]MCP2262112.1 Zinc carboxypeptidase [Streptoalloteichus tenebrarius]BFF02266.1 M14 family zinc carboxypeptidase [Streptoalloteichus tenebrarius]
MSRSLLRRALLAAAFVLPMALSGAPAVAGSPPPEDPPPSVWRVAASGPQARALADAGFDVVETHDDAVLVVGPASTADRLRDLGYRPRFHDTVHKPVEGAENAPADTFYGGYHTPAAHEAHLDQVAAAHPGLATVVDIGDSWRRTRGLGGHDIKAICLTRKKEGDCALRPNAAKPRLAVIAQIHARELATGEVAWRWIDHLAGGYGVDAEVTSVLDSTEVWVVPIANPDGVDIVASGGDRPRMQRKNANTSNGACGGTTIGIDLNRNSSFRWGGDSTRPCAETYQGPRAASEPETRALETWFSALFPDRRGQGDDDPAPRDATGVMITLHSYGNYIITPWGWTERPAPNDAQLRALGRKMAQSNGYVVGTNGDTVGYSTTGTTDDYTYGVLGVASFTFEIGSSSGSCGGFFPQYSCVNSVFWPKNRGALMTAAKAAAAPYQTT